VAIEDLREDLMRGARWLDVRAPVEFAQGHVPGACNLPLLNDEERTVVGTTYKREGSKAAVELGHRLVCGAVKAERIGAWRDFLKAEGAVIYCFRGGLRSRISQSWLSEEGVEIRRLDGGYKSARRFFMRETESIGRRLPLTVIAGSSGSGKTKLLRALAADRPVLDLEKLANHRGSAFGALSESQPSQPNFENQLALELMRKNRAGGIVAIEDEGWTIGRLLVPSALFQNLSRSPLVCIEEPLEARAESIWQEYVRDAVAKHGQAAFTSLVKGVDRISRKLGGARSQEILAEIHAGEREFQTHGTLNASRDWILKLLTWYYDPFYEKHLSASLDRIRFRGTQRECSDFLRSLD
jgi:tRNA 2-selenouridine synthase